MLSSKIRYLRSWSLGVVLLLGAVSTVFAEQRYPDRLLEYKNTDIILGSHPALFWAGDRLALLNAEAVQHFSERYGDPYVVAYDFSVARATILARHARIQCFFPDKGYGVVQTRIQRTPDNDPEMPEAGLFKVKVGSGGKVAITPEKAKLADCHSAQWNKDWGGQQVVDLGPGNGVLLGGNNNPALQNAEVQQEHISYVHEDGKRFEFAYPSQNISAVYDLGKKITLISIFEGKLLFLDKDHRLRTMPADESPQRFVRQFFKSGSGYAVRDGVVIYTSLDEGLNLDVFFYRKGMATPMRIYATRGYGDLPGRRGVSPDGCLVLDTHLVDGFMNRYLSPLFKKQYRLHYTNVCTAFGE